jgi:hypothetical protein
MAEQHMAEQHMAEQHMAEEQQLPALRCWPQQMRGRAADC